MQLQSLKAKLLVGICVLVMGSGMFISVMVTHRYSRSLFEALGAQAAYLTHAVALEAADFILVNDLVALQKMLDHQIHSNPSLSYLFIVRNGQVLAHTFANGVPEALVTANEATSNADPHPREIVATTGEFYLDMALPVFGGKAGVLRLGLSEQHYREQVTRLWLQIGGLTLGILLLAVTGGLFFVRRITGPLTELAQAADRVDRGELSVRVNLHGKDEVATLGASFNRMVASIQTYTGRLEEQTMELERAHQQTRAFCGLVQEIGALHNLQEIGVFLIQSFQPIVQSVSMVILVLNESRDTLYLLNETQAAELREPNLVSQAASIIGGWEHGNSLPAPHALVKPPFVPEDFPVGTSQTLVPIAHDQRVFGGLIIACGEQCRCRKEEVDLVGSMLTQAAGVIKRAILHEDEVRELHTRLESSQEFFGIVSKDPKMQVIFKLIEDIASTDATVLIQGESGTGKELVARAIHEQSPRKIKPFVVIDCSAYPATLLESELFGHEKGAFTGALRQKSGRFEQADGGTVFLDEIGEIPLSAQIKLLRVLQTQTFERVGGEKSLSVDVRILAATNRNLLEEVRKGQFREDLYYRLNVIPIHLPPLKQRRNDVPLLARHFLRRFALSHGKPLESLSPEAMGLLLDHSWPGNVRELENTIEHAVVLAKGPRIGVADLPASIRSLTAAAQPSERGSTFADHERTLLREAMEQCGWNKKKAAHRLGISRSTLYEKLKKHRIVPPTSH
jgi:two-component system response regulator HydG